MTFDALTMDDMEKVRKWRNEDISGARTPYLLTQEMQESFYHNQICSRDSRHRYWAIREGSIFSGIAGLTDIEWENGCAEVALMIDPLTRGNGYGAKAFGMILHKAFEEMRLAQVYGIVYHCNRYMGFWEKMIHEYMAFSTVLPGRKYYDGKRYDATYFSIES